MCCVPCTLSPCWGSFNKSPQYAAPYVANTVWLWHPCSQNCTYDTVWCYMSICVRCKGVPYAMHVIPEWLTIAQVHRVCSSPYMPSQRTRDAKKRHYCVKTTSFWRNNDVIIALRVGCVIGDTLSFCYIKALYESFILELITCDDYLNVSKWRHRTLKIMWIDRSV